MSNVITPAFLNTKQLQHPQIGHGNTKLSTTTSKHTPKVHLCYNADPVLKPLSFSPLKSSSSNRNCTEVDNVKSKSFSNAISKSPFNYLWICSQEYVKNGTPSRIDGLSLISEMTFRRKGTNFIRHVSNHLKIKPICKETAYVYFHRFFMLRSFKKCDSIRFAMASLFLACKFEDVPTFKDRLIRCSYMLIKRRELTKSEKVLIL